jgi:hypothetical protein
LLLLKAWFLKKNKANKNKLDAMMRVRIYFKISLQREVSQSPQVSTIGVIFRILLF